jgi:hypothetical protein
MPYPDYYELDQAVKRGRKHLDQWIIDHGVKNSSSIYKEESEKQKNAETIADSSEAGQQERQRIQALKQLGMLLKDQVQGVGKDQVQGVGKKEEEERVENINHHENHQGEDQQCGFTEYDFEKISAHYEQIG